MSSIREKANRFIVRALESRGIKGIVPSHGAIMVHLFAGGDWTMKELAAKIGRTQPTVTVLVDKLVACGYVRKEKSPQDSRVTFIRPTAAGLALRPVFEAISAELNALVYGGLTAEEADRLEKTLAAIAANFDAE